MLRLSSRGRLEEQLASMRPRRDEGVRRRRAICCAERLRMRPPRRRCGATGSTPRRPTGSHDGALGRSVCPRRSAHGSQFAAPPQISLRCAAKGVERPSVQARRPSASHQQDARRTTEKQKHRSSSICGDPAQESMEGRACCASGRRMLRCLFADSERIASKREARQTARRFRICAERLDGEPECNSSLAGAGGPAPGLRGTTNKPHRRGRAVGSRGMTTCWSHLHGPRRQQAEVPAHAPCASVPRETVASGAARCTTLQHGKVSRFSASDRAPPEWMHRRCSRDRPTFRRPHNGDKTPGPSRPVMQPRDLEDQPLWMAKYYCGGYQKMERSLDTPPRPSMCSGRLCA
jgi:hypothetical protein